MSWDYADMSKDASKHGGPEQYVNSIFQSGREYEHEEQKGEKLIIGVVTLGIGGLLGMFVPDIVNKISNKWKTKKESILEKANEQKRKLIETMNEQEENKSNQIESFSDNDSSNKKEK